MHRFIVFFLLLLGSAAVAPQNGHAQEYAVFIHGFTFGDDRGDPLSEKGQRWTESGTPQDWKNRGLIDGHILLKYYDRELYTNTNGVMAGWVQQMKNKGQNARWIIVGHSQGGIAARELHKYISSRSTGLKVRGVLSVASPMQGARPALVSYGSRTGYKNVKGPLNQFLKDVIHAPVADTAEDTFFASISYLGIPYSGFIQVGFNILTNFWDPTKYLADGIISIAEPTIRGKLHAMAVDKNAKAYIGPDGSIVKSINSFSTRPPEYRALIGSEATPATSRLYAVSQTRYFVTGLPYLGFLGEGINQYTNNQSPIGLILSAAGGGDLIAPGDEAKAIDFVDNVQWSYRFIENHYEGQEGWFDRHCKFGTRYPYNPCTRSSRWRKGRRALEGIEQLRVKLIDSYKTERRTGYRTVCDQTQYDNGVPYFSRDKALPIDDPYGTVCWQEPYTYYVTLVDKSDGLLGVEYCKWGKNDNPNDGRHNFLYGASGSTSARGGGSGYNHGEMVYAKRRYTSSGDRYHVGASFNKGNLNPPMRDQHTWLRTNVFP